MEKTGIAEINSSIQNELEGKQGKYLTFWVDSQLFGISIAYVEQIISMQEITPIPEYPDYAKGIISLRGSIIPLIDIRLRLGKQEAEYGERTCIIVTNISDRFFGFIVDEVDEVTEILERQISLPPKMNGEIANSYLTGIARLETEDRKADRIVLIIDTVKILGEDELEVLIQDSDNDKILEAGK